MKKSTNYVLKGLVNMMKMQEITWTHKTEGWSESRIANEDYIDIIYGELMGTYWDSVGGWDVDVVIRDTGEFDPYWED